jgi:hypothetical protein
MPFPITLEFGPKGGSVRLKSMEDARAFAVNEWNKTNWLGFVGQIGDRLGTLDQVTSAWKQYSNSYNNFTVALTQGNESAAESELRQLFSGKLVPISISIEGQLLDHIRSELGSRGALGALCTLCNYRFDANDPLQTRGAIAAHELLSGTGKAARKAVQDSLSGMLARSTQLQRDGENLADELDGRIASTVANQKHRLIRYLRRWRGARLKYSAEIESRVRIQSDGMNSAIADIKAVESTFVEYMRLKAPVVYWRGKAKIHADLACRSAILGSLYALSALFLSVMFGVDYVLKLVTKVIHDTNQWQSAYVVLALVAFVATIVFWMGRLLSRYYLSQSHLAIDAEERATMVETYLALTKDNQISDEERILVLGSLFRPSSDGMSNGDGSPDLGIAGLVSRLASGNAK